LKSAAGIPLRFFYAALKIPGTLHYLQKLLISATGRFSDAIINNGYAQLLLIFQKKTVRQRAPKYHPPRKSSFYLDLNEKVGVYFKNGRSRGASGLMVFKIILFLVLFVFCYVHYIHPGQTYASWFGWCMAMGVASMLVGLNIGHDAAHHSISRKKWLNSVAAYSFDLIGVSSYVWHLKHNLLHHNYPNVIGVDTDIEASPILRLSPADRIRSFHRFQHLYAPLVYTLFSLNLLLVNDLAMLFRIRREDIDGKKHPRYIVPGIAALKLANIAYMLVIPIWVLPFEWWHILIGFLFMHATLSLLLAFVLLPAHLFESTAYCSKDDGEIPEDWAAHQVRTTLDFSPDSRIMNFLLGGFNTNVVHHLFPRICHCYYKDLTQIVKSVAAEHDLPYHETSLAGSIKQHFKALKILGTQKTNV
jgi:linoleoyl-CoA desaturase